MCQSVRRELLNSGRPFPRKVGSFDDVEYLTSFAGNGGVARRISREDEFERHVDAFHTRSGSGSVQISQGVRGGYFWKHSLCPRAN